MGPEQVEKILAELEPGQIVTDPEVVQAALDTHNQGLNQRRLGRGFQSVMKTTVQAKPVWGERPDEDAAAFFGLRAS